MLSNDIYIHFALEKETGKIVISKEHAETLHSILNPLEGRGGIAPSKMAITAFNAYLKRRSP